MFNEEVKAAFIDEYSESRKTPQHQVTSRILLEGFFKRLEPYEQQFNKDCADFTFDEALQFFKDINAVSIQVLLNYNTKLRQYTSFFNQTVHDEYEDYGEYGDITKDDLLGCLSKSRDAFLTREEILQIQDSVSVLDATIIECLWEGIEGRHMSDLTGISADKIDKYGVLRINGHTYPLSEKLQDLLNQVFEMDEEYLTGSSARTLSVDVSKYKGRLCKIDGDTEDKRYRWVIRKFKKISADLVLTDFNARIIKQSGLLDKLRQVMIEERCTFKQAVFSEEGKNILERYGFDTSKGDCRPNFLRRFKHLFQS